MVHRIAFARINQETNALSSVETTLEDFADAHLLEGSALLSACAPGRGSEVPGFFARAELSGFVDALRPFAADVEPVPIVSAWAAPAGPLTQAAFDPISREPNYKQTAVRVERSAGVAGGPS